MKKLIIFLSSIFLTITLKTYAQTAPFQIAIEPMNSGNLGGLQAFAWGQHNGKWLIIGGRLDGLHRRQPFAAFDIAGHNNQLIVFDPVSTQKWSAPLSSLPYSIQEQLSATNMEFYQEGDYLYLIGGYGYSNTFDNHITYPNLTAIKVPDVINSIISNKSFASYFRQIEDIKFAVTGGYLNKINNTFYLTGGQKFVGRYNPMGPNNGPGFTQEYTNSIRKFSLIDNGMTLKVTHLPEIKDVTNLHRRDYNVVPQIMPKGQEGLTAFSGVFQIGVDLPYLNCVNIDSTGHTVNNSFTQYYNHYHCSHIPLFSTSKNEMHTIFFGGIAQYYDSFGILVQDNNVPFVKTIARVTRDANGVMAEYKLPIEMPSLLGASSEFIPVEGLPKFKNEVFNLDKFIGDSILIGYIYGGISSTASNIFFTNTGSQSKASSQIFKVYLIKNTTVGIHELNKQSIGTLQMRVMPNPNNGNFKIDFNLTTSTDVQLSVSDGNGKLIYSKELKNLKEGTNSYLQEDNKIPKGAAYYVTLQTKHEKATQKIIIEP
jgi:hypothetical protein